MYYSIKEEPAVAVLNHARSATTAVMKMATMMTTAASALPSKRVLSFSCRRHLTSIFTHLDPMKISGNNPHTVHNLGETISLFLSLCP